MTLLSAVNTSGTAEQAHADTAPPDSGTPSTVSSDALPTAQMNGVAWSQVVIGNTVFVGGDFTKARPAGAASGASTEVARTDLMAYDITTGVMTSFAPTLDGQVQVVAASPDGKTLYAGGSFATVNGAARSRVAAFDVSTGNLLPFAPTPNSTVYGLYPTATTVYLGGSFDTVNGVSRSGIAAVAVATGLLTAFAPTTSGGAVRELVGSPDGSKLAIGGAFTTVNGYGNPGYGLALLDTSTGGSLPMPVNALIRDASTNAGITSLVPTPDGSGFYGSGFSYQKTTGNFEGAFKADWNGNLIWIEDCHGDTYSVFPQGGDLYVTGHAHYCGNVGGFPQTSPQTIQHAIAFGDSVAGGAIEKDQYGYFNYEGQPHPPLLTWFPDFTVGTYTGQSQAAWTVSGNADYVVFGGEFPQVNGKAQQGLVRFARTGLAPNTDAPRLQSSDFNPTITPFAQGLRLSWPANYDRDNELLTYTILKNSSTTPVYMGSARSTFWQRPTMSWFDRNVTPGTAVSYRLQVMDPKGNVRQGDKVTVTPSSGGTVLSAYDKGILGDSPLYYWPMTEAAGATTAVDLASGENATIGSGVTAGVPGAIAGDPGTAYRYSGTSNASTVATQTARVGLRTFSVEAWFKTTTTKGGRIIGFGNKASGDSGTSDRMVYMGKTGKLDFGVYPAAYKTVASPNAYNDGQWHHTVATEGPDGMKLYVDGSLVGSLATNTNAQIISGYWRLGGDYIYGWPDNPTSTQYFTGDLAHEAVYNYVLNASQVSAHKAAPVNAAPTASFTANTTDLTTSVDATASSDSDGYVASSSWNWGDGTTSTGTKTTHSYATAGTYTITLTVTDENGATGTASRTVTTTTPNVPPTSSFTYSGSGLAYSFDGTGSADSDGTIASYSWNFGDNTAAGSGATVTHTYFAGGTYNVALTVTDNRGGTTTSTQSITVTAPANSPWASDAFERTVASGLGTADLGGVWTTSGASGFAVGSGAGVWKLPSAGATRTAYLGATQRDSTDLTMNVVPTAVANGSGIYLTVLGRRISSNTDYHTNIRITSANKVTVSLGALEGSTTQTSLSSTVTLAGTVNSGDQIHVRMQTYGTSPTTVAAKVWLGSDPEPSAWTVSATDSYAALQAAGSVGLTTYLSTSSTNTPNDVKILDLAARPVA